MSPSAATWCSHGRPCIRNIRPMHTQHPASPPLRGCGCVFIAPTGFSQWRDSVAGMTVVHRVETLRVQLGALLGCAVQLAVQKESDGHHHPDDRDGSGPPLLRQWLQCHGWRLGGSRRPGVRGFCGRSRARNYRRNAAHNPTDRSDPSAAVSKDAFKGYPTNTVRRGEETETAAGGLSQRTRTSGWGRCWRRRRRRCRRRRRRYGLRG